MTFLSAMFGWAVREGWMAHNPVARLRVGERAAPEGKRAPFSNEQLQAIFSEPPWSPRDATGAGDPAHYWGPLIALYHGLRRGEIAQLAPQDVKEIEKVWVMRVRGERRKTRSEEHTTELQSRMRNSYAVLCLTNNNTTIVFRVAQYI